MADRRSLHRAAQRLAVMALTGILLALTACVVEAPSELEPTGPGAAQCPSLQGIWDLSATPGLARAFPGDTGPKGFGDTVTAIRIAPLEDRRIVVDFLADAQAVVAAADALRESDPASYAHWRTRVEADAADEEVAALGPALSVRRTFGDGSCKDGWMSLGYQRHAPDEKGRHFTGIALSRNRLGELLVRRHFSQTKDAGFNFFGQRVTYERDAGSSVSRLALRADAQALSMRRLRDLPLGVDPAELATWRARAPDRLVHINTRILASLPASVIPAEFKLLNLDVTSAKAVPDHFRIAMAATFPETPRGDLLLETLQALPEVSGLELASQEDAGHGRRRTAVVFEYRD